MNIAILYSGLPINNFSDFLSNHKNFIFTDNHNIDTYISTYITDSNSIEYIQKIIALLNPKKINIESFEDVKNNILDQYIQYIIKNKFTRDCRPINALSMFYKIKKCFSLLSDINYDIIIRTRFDIKFDSKINLEINHNINVPKCGDFRGGLLDMFAYGNYHIMKLYCSLFDHIEQYMKEGIIFHPESILRYHCLKQDIKINRFPFHIYLRNQNFTQISPCID